MTPSSPSSLMVRLGQLTLLFISGVAALVDLPQVGLLGVLVLFALGRSSRGEVRQRVEENTVSVEDCAMRLREALDAREGHR